MVFDSIEFAIFLFIAMAVYWLPAIASRIRIQNLLILGLSYFFYGWWDWRFLGLIAVSSLIDYAVCVALDRTEAASVRRLLLAFSVISNLGMLAYFKYVDFFAQSLSDLALGLGFDLSWTTLNVVLPVGISFYTFQTLSYTIDVYRRELKASRDPIAFFAYVAFFPQLVAGPIERAANLLPQFYVHRRFDSQKAVDGCRQILWGLFKKVVVADSAARIVDAVFAGHDQLASGWLVLAAIAFSIQIYCDFSGYSDVAIGLSRLFGFELAANFRYPFFACNIADFWKRWHISLSTWFRDYVYIPLGGSRCGTLRHVSNVMAVFMISGLWHGANATFLVWGLIHGLLFVPLILLDRVQSQRNRKNTESGSSVAIQFLRVLFTFTLVTLAFVIFRSETIDDAVRYLSQIFLNVHDFSWADLKPVGIRRSNVAGLAIAVLILLLVEWRNRDRRHGLEIKDLPWAVRWSAYYALLFTLAINFDTQRPFIYFQF